MKTLRKKIENYKDNAEFGCVINILDDEYGYCVNENRKEYSIEFISSVEKEFMLEYVFEKMIIPTKYTKEILIKENVLFTNYRILNEFYPSEIWYHIFYMIDKYKDYKYQEEKINWFHTKRCWVETTDEEKIKDVQEIIKDIKNYLDEYNNHLNKEIKLNEKQISLYDLLKNNIK